MTTAEVIRLLCCDSGPWQPAPAPKKGPIFVRNKGSEHCVSHAENWLLKEIHGVDYEWAEIL